MNWKKFTTTQEAGYVKYNIPLYLTILSGNPTVGTGLAMVPDVKIDCIVYKTIEDMRVADGTLVYMFSANNETNAVQFWNRCQKDFKNKNINIKDFKKEQLIVWNVIYLVICGYYDNVRNMER